MSESDDIRARISERLEIMGLTIQGASLKAGLSQTTLRDFMVGRAQSATLRTLSKLAPVLGVPVEWLHTGRYPDRREEQPEAAEFLDILSGLTKQDREIVLNLARNLGQRKKA